MTTEVFARSFSWALVAASISLVPVPASAAPESSEQATVTVSNLLVRIQGEDEIGLAGGDFKLQVLERLKARGFRALGAENLVFDKDESHKAAYRLGGVIRELACEKLHGNLRCRIGVEWQLLSVAQDTVVYSVMARYAVLDGLWEERKQYPSRLLMGALDALLGREKFKDALRAGTAPTPPAKPGYASATFGACPPHKKKMPEASEHVLNATVLVKNEQGFGSGVFLTPDGLILTAAHVLHGEKTIIKLRDGAEVEAIPIRLDRETDVALLRTARPISGQTCLEPTASVPAVGAEVYAVGAPADEKLAFSMTRGILSGLRELDGKRKLQTDAAVSPGNSGGPLVDGEGRLTAIVTSKISGKRVEGVAFGVATSDVLASLALVPGATTDDALRSGTLTPSTTPPRQEPQIDTPDSIPSLDPEGDLARVQEQQQQEEKQKTREIEEWRRAERARLTSPGLKGLFWGSLATGALGIATGTISYARYDNDESTRSEFYRLRVINAAGWTLAAAGGVGVLVYLAKRPPLPAWPGATPAQATLRLHPAGVSVTGSF